MPFTWHSHYWVYKYLYNTVLFAFAFKELTPRNMYSYAVPQIKRLTVWQTNSQLTWQADKIADSYGTTKHEFQKESSTARKNEILPNWICLNDAKPRMSNNLRQPLLILLKLWNKTTTWQRRYVINQKSWFRFCASRRQIMCKLFKMPESINSFELKQNAGVTVVENKINFYTKPYRKTLQISCNLKICVSVTHTPHRIKEIGIDKWLLRYLLLSEKGDTRLY